VLPQHDQGAGLGPEDSGSAAEIFGLTLRRLRTQAGLSLRELGRRALYDYTRLSRAESGQILIPAHQVSVLDNVLHAGGLLTTLRQAAETGTVAGPVAHCTVTGSGPVMLEIRLPGGGSIQVSLSRRQFAQLIAAGALSSALPGAATAENASRLARAVDQPARLDNEVISYFRRALSEYYSADKMLGPARLIGPVLAQIEVLDSLRRGARPPHADPLLRILAQYGEMAGWLLQDSGDLEAAASWSRRAAEWAHCAGDTQMAAYMLIRHSNIATLTDDHTAVVHLAAAARRMPGPAEPKLTALALQQQARGHARLGEFRTCFALLDQAAETLRDHPAVSDPGAPEYLHHYDLSTLEEQTAICYREAGRADTAVTILENKISTIPATLIRDRGHLTAKLAVAVTQASEPDPGRAAHLGMTALTISGQTGSARTIRELRTLEGQLLAQWPHHPQTVSFSEALAAA
jgi:transcriptional regulator with XRE-family HTH domain